MIVIVAPSVEYALRFDCRRKDVRVETFVAQTAVEAFDERILHRFAGPNELEPDLVRVRPRIHGAADEFTAVVPSGKEVITGQLLL